MLTIRNLSLALPDRAAAKMFGTPPLRTILSDINLTVAPGECVGLVGESGSGKTTLGRAILRLYRPTAGSIDFAGQDLVQLDESALRPLREKMQMIFQDPLSSLNPRKRIEQIIAQPLLTAGRVQSDQVPAAVRALLQRVHLPVDFAQRYPHQLSGGQRQRVGIARAIALNPAFIVADEILSGLDVSTQAHILMLLRELRTSLGMAMVFITHDLSVVRVLCDRVVVMRHGSIVESGPTEQLFSMPSHDYTRELLDAIPLPDVDRAWLDAA